MTTTVIVPAYNEATVIGRLLDALADGPGEAPPRVIVVCNGCTDGTAALARAHPSGPEVVELAEGSKHLALAEGDRLAQGYPRFYVDADVVVSGHDIARMAGALSNGVLAVAPQRRLRLESSGRLVRSYYRIWESLPGVASGLYGRGVVGVAAEGAARTGERPEVLGDDLWLHARFADQERRVVDGAFAEIHPPRTAADLLRRRVRAVQGNTQLHRSAGGDGAGHLPRSTSVADVAGIVRSDPRRAPDAVVFVLVAVAAGVLGRLRRRTSWLRDEGSRS